MANLRRNALSGPFLPAGGHCWNATRLSLGDNDKDPFQSSLLLYEDGVPLPLAHQLHGTIRRLGQGRYSHWEAGLFFSASDNSDPNRNGRVYQIEFGYTLEQWQRAVLKHLCALWNLHPKSSYYLARGGRDFPPPLFCNLGLTNKCNLRCEICGSQKFLDETGTRRRHMAKDKFMAVAETLFPFMVEVELNSQGDPLLHPDIEEILEQISHHGCDIKVQTNGTLFSERIIDRLVDCHGIVNISLDAVGDKFDEVRRGGNWRKAEPGLYRFLTKRDSRRMTVGLYPTVTRRTLNEVVPILDWAAEHALDAVSFHRYSPIQNSTEEEPTLDERRSVKERIYGWLAAHRAQMEVTFDGEKLTPVEVTPALRRTQVASPQKRAFTDAFWMGRFFFAPTDRDSNMGDPLICCTAPFHYVEIGLDGQISACCRSQDVALGYATSVEAFADAWLGANYRKIRESLHRDASGPYPLPNCEGCVNFFAPKAGRGRGAVDYSSNQTDASLLILDPGEVVTLEGVQLEQGYCKISRLPPGVDQKRYRLWEDDRKLGPENCVHEEIRKIGLGRYSIWGRALYFSSSDNSDPRRNGRQYTLRAVNRD